MSIAFTIDGLKLVNTLNAREHQMVTARRKKQEHDAVTACAPGKVTTQIVKFGRTAKQHVYRCWWAVQPALPVEVTLTRVYTSRGQAMDPDGLAASMKGVQDSVAELLRVDDGDTAKVSWRYRQVRGAKYGVVVEVEPRVALAAEEGARG